jgi:hypothetical protein
MMPRNAALAHEAGHAVVATHEGGTIRRVTIFSRSMSGIELWGGQCMDAAKLDDHPERSDEEYRAYAQRLKQVWDVALAILRANREPFLRSAGSFTRGVARNKRGGLPTKKCDALSDGLNALRSGAYNF